MVESGSQIPGGSGYPVQFSIEYPDRALNRLTTAFRIIVVRFSNRIGVYLALMDDRYPSTDERQAVALDFPYPDAKEGLNRWLPIVKWLLAIPHVVLLVFLWFAALVAVVVAWFAILFTGRYPRGLFDFVLGVFRWTNRVVGYAFILVTDQYPPFQLNP